MDLGLQPKYPHFCGESMIWLEPLNGSTPCCRRQIFYDGCLGKPRRLIAKFGRSLLLIMFVGSESAPGHLAESLDQP